MFIDDTMQNINLTYTIMLVFIFVQIIEILYIFYKHLLGLLIG